MRLFLILTVFVAVVQHSLAFISQPSTQQTNPHHRCSSSTTSDAAAVYTRRELINAATLALPALVIAQAAQAATADVTTYTDPRYGFSFEVPAAWKKAESEISGRRPITIWSAPQSSCNVFIAVTPVKPDFTSLTSFGSVDEVSRTLLPEGQGISSKLLALASKGGKYCYDYTIAQDGRPEKRLRSIWSMVPSVALVTLTVQCDSEEYSKFASDYDTIINSFKYA